MHTLGPSHYTRYLVPATPRAHTRKRVTGVDSHDLPK